MTTKADRQRANLIRLAKADLGATDAEPFAREAYAGILPMGWESQDWCGIWLLSVLRREGLTNWTWEIGKGFLYKLPQTSNPRPGDLFYMHAHNHQGMYLGRTDTGKVQTIDGNSIGGAVALNERNPTDIAAYYSIDPLLAPQPQSVSTTLMSDSTPDSISNWVPTALVVVSVITLTGLTIWGVRRGKRK